MRAAYRLVRFPFHLVDDVVLPVIFDEQAPVRRAYGKFFLDCDGAAAYLLADDTSAVHASFLRRRSAAFHDAIARHPSSIHTEADVVMEHHREGNDASAVDGVLTIFKDTEVLAIYRPGSWKAVRRDKDVTRYINKQLSPISIETIEDSATSTGPETTVD